MTPKQAMFFGSAVGIGLLLAGIFGVMPPSMAFVLFGFGALFGKGYGVWEERSRLSPEAPASSKEEGE